MERLITDGTTRMIGWSILGAVLARGMASFIPNLGRRNATVAGGVGGLVGGVLLLAVEASLDGVIGRLTGAFVLGFSIGLMVVLAELAARDAWLEIGAYGSREKRIVNLGKQTVSIGSDDATCQVLVNGVAPEALRYEVRDGRITCEDLVRGCRLDVQAGDQRRVGRVTVSVCSSSCSSFGSTRQCGREHGGR